MPPKGEDVIKTLVELLERQDEIKITYTLGNINDLSPEERAERKEKSRKALEVIRAQRGY